MKSDLLLTGSVKHSSERQTLYSSFLITLHPVESSKGAGTYPSLLQAKGKLCPGLVTSPSRQAITLRLNSAIRLLEHQSTSYGLFRVVRKKKYYWGAITIIWVKRRQEERHNLVISFLFFSFFQTGTVAWIMLYWQRIWQGLIITYWLVTEIHCLNDNSVFQQDKMKLCISLIRAEPFRVKMYSVPAQALADQGKIQQKGQTNYSLMKTK